MNDHKTDILLTCNPSNVTRTESHTVKIEWWSKILIFYKSVKQMSRTRLAYLTYCLIKLEKVKVYSIIKVIQNRLYKKKIFSFVIHTLFQFNDIHILFRFTGSSVYKFVSRIFLPSCIRLQCIWYYTGTLKCYLYEEKKNNSCRTTPVIKNSYIGHDIYF